MIGKQWLGLLLVFACCLLYSTLPSAFGADIQRLIGPVRFSPDQAKAAQAVPEVRSILEKFNKAGYTTALWAVGTLPAATNAIKPWLETCVAAFPEPPILALDSALLDDEDLVAKIEGKLVYDLAPGFDRKAKGSGICAKLRPFLLTEKSLEVFLPLALPRVHSVMINFKHLNNLACKAEPARAIARTRENAALVRSIAMALGHPVFLWLQVDDSTTAAGGLEEWVTQLGPEVDGIELNRWHEWNAGLEESYAPSLAIFRQTGKPVLRGGFRYMGARLRPGIEKDLSAMYRDRIRMYEDWVKKAGFAGYEREIGTFIPDEVSPNMNLLPE